MIKENHDDELAIGCRRNGMVLVCHGDDEPDEFADWLRPLVDDFRRISSIASERDVTVSLEDGSAPIPDVMSFCDRLGIKFQSNMWEGSMISGIYRFGWLKTGTVRSASAAGRNLLKSLKKRTEVEVRAAVIRELEGMKDLNDLLDRTADDRHVLRSQIAKLSGALNAAECAAREAKEKLQEAQEADTSQIDKACLEMAVALLNKEKRRIVVGPLALWDDGLIYALVSWGGVSIPEDSSPALLVSELERAGHRVVRVSDQTVIGGWLSGPIYSRGPANISGWADAWSRRERQARTFVTDPPEFSDQVRQIHEALSAERK